MDERLLIAFAAGLIRCQAGSAVFSMGSNTEIKRNWPVPRYIWQLPGGSLSLARDQFTAPISGSSSQALAEDSTLVGVAAVTLLELKTHEGELRKHFQMPQRGRRQHGAKAITLTACEKWLRQEFRKDSRHLRRKDDFMEDALAKYKGSLTKRGFFSVWRKVTMEADHKKRREGGRPEGT
ncbi:hypothetical protein OIK40_04140 [Erythrobacter sp. sf7]|uniref:Uncharacterized protein n=1 Tax=Erythrobacter fulvus TaxID=2987523 RepID=A0ABT5JMJ0_9SPHN|nr:hypothetical protein [Erythrobacter fulvus]MDC8753829.1 hypothetical protein [Erythrobacter fulvus]